MWVRVNPVPLWLPPLLSSRWISQQMTIYTDQKPHCGGDKDLCSLLSALRGHTTNFTNKYQFINHKKYNSCKNSCIISSVALREAVLKRYYATFKRRNTFFLLQMKSWINNQLNEPILYSDCVSTQKVFEPCFSVVHLTCFYFNRSSSLHRPRNGSHFTRSIHM